MEIIKKYATQLGLIFLCCFLIWPALKNGYPFVQPDTGTYIAAGYGNELPIDRPIFYSFFVRHISLSHSLWFVIIIQSFIVSYIIHMVVKRFLNRSYWTYTAFIVFILSLTTGLSNYTSQIMPDIYSAITIIGIALILTSKKLKKYDSILIIILIFSTVTHFSNLIITSIILTTALVTFFFKLISFHKLLKALAIVSTSFFLILIVNYSYSNKFEISKSGNIFLLARLTEIGVVEEFLEDNCTHKEYIFCKQNKQLPKTAIEFLWNKNDSPLYNQECLAKDWRLCWLNKNEEIGFLIKDLFKNSYYRNKIFKTYFFDFFKQLIDFNIGKLIPNKIESPTHNWIKFKFKNELSQFENSKQYSEILYFKTMSKIQLILVALSLIIITYYLTFSKKHKLNKTQLSFIIFVLVGIIGNALTSSIFSTVESRYQSRVIWIIPLVAIVLIIKHYQSNKTINKTHTT